MTTDPAASILSPLAQGFARRSHLSIVGRAISCRLCRDVLDGPKAVIFSVATCSVPGAPVAPAVRISVVVCADCVDRGALGIVARAAAPGHEIRIDDGRAIVDKRGRAPSKRAAARALSPTGYGVAFAHDVPRPDHDPAPHPNDAVEAPTVYVTGPTYETASNGSLAEQRAIAARILGPRHSGEPTLFPLAD